MAWQIATGIILAVIILELLPRILEATALVLGLAAAAIYFFLVTEAGRNLFIGAAFFVALTAIFKVIEKYLKDDK